MALKEIANSSCTVSANNGVTATPVPVPSLTCKAGGSPILTQMLNVTLAGGQSGTCVGSAGAGVINATAMKVKVDGQFVLRKGDTGTGTVAGVDSGTGSPCVINVDLEIDDAGQTKVLAN